jgi:hypothetical protein
VLLDLPHDASGSTANRSVRTGPVQTGTWVHLAGVFDAANG